MFYEYGNLYNSLAGNSVRYFEDDVQGPTVFAVNVCAYVVDGIFIDGNAGKGTRSGVISTAWYDNIVFLLYLLRVEAGICSKGMYLSSNVYSQWGKCLAPSMEYPRFTRVEFEAKIRTVCQYVVFLKQLVRHTDPGPQFVCTR